MKLVKFAENFKHNIMFQQDTEFRPEYRLPSSARNLTDAVTPSEGPEAGENDLFLKNYVAAWKF